MDFVHRIDALRDVMKTEHLDAFIFSDSDGHHSLPMADHWKTVAFLSGFNGKDGLLVVTMSRASLWLDSHNFPMAQEQLDETSLVLMEDGGTGSPSISDWLGKELENANGAIVGIDGSVTSFAFISTLKEELRQQGGINLRINFDPLKVIWVDRPQIPVNKVEISLQPTGMEHVNSRIACIRSALRKMHVDGILMSDAQDIARIMNLHDAGGETQMLSEAYLLVSPDSAILYLCRQRLTPAIVAFLKTEAVEVDDYTNIQHGLRNYFAYNILMDPEETNALLPEFIHPRTKIIFDPSPISALKE